jgi:hypothetical protein
VRNIRWRETQPPSARHGISVAYTATSQVDDELAETTEKLDVASPKGVEMAGS